MNMFSRNVDEANPSESRMEIEIVDNTNSYRLRNKDRVMAVQKNGRIVIGDEGLLRLEVLEGDYLLFGKVDGDWYVCKRPSGSFKGYRVTKQQGKNAKAIYVQSKALNELEQGEYNLGPAFEQGGIFWRHLTKVE